MGCAGCWRRSGDDHGAARVLVWPAPVDFRRGMDSLAALVQVTLRLDPFLCVGRGYVAAPSRSEQFRSVGEFRRHIISHSSPRGQGVPGPLAMGRGPCWSSTSSIQGYSSDFGVEHLVATWTELPRISRRSATSMTQPSSISVASAASAILRLALQ